MWKKVVNLPRAIFGNSLNRWFKRSDSKEQFFYESGRQYQSRDSGAGLTVSYSIKVQRLCNFRGIILRCVNEQHINPQTDHFCNRYFFNVHDLTLLFCEPRPGRTFIQHCRNLKVGIVTCYLQCLAWYLIYSHKPSCFTQSVICTKCCWIIKTALSLS